MKREFVAYLIMSTVVSISFASTPSFQGLGDLPGGGFSSFAFDVSADGSVVVGRSSSALGIEAFRWENGVMIGLGNLGGSHSDAQAVSADGSVVVGISNLKAFRWENGVISNLGSILGGSSQNYGRGLSANGEVAVGYNPNYSTGTQAFRWENGVMEGLGNLGRSYSAAYGASEDGQIVVGNSRSSFGSEAFRWENGSMEGLGDLEGGSFYSSARDISDNGNVIVGTGYSTYGWEAFRWEDGVMSGWEICLAAVLTAVPLQFQQMGLLW